ncbi:hypothetical protein FOMPIDRAFT_112949 [Fomitopsis schrenkii]|uniref:Uncharacterized protein n=1 Tax=Fomitopsis schrenkii TaxID=2126942 RepID=S8DPS0_FOMSC|nr:hypothetical protein FOMPIDRAFT_112949 [Fomitopsis schrenkii]
MALSLSMVRFPSKDRPTRPKLPLGKIRRLTLSGIQGSNDIGNLINYVAIPSDASILFRDCKPLSPELVDGSQGLKNYFIRRPWTRLSRQPVSGRPVSHVSVIGTDDQVGVVFDWATGEHSGSELGYRLRFPIPLPGVHECWIMEPTDTPAALSVSGLHVIFHSMAGLRTLVVCAWNAHTVLDALELPPDKSASNMDIFRVCPILTELCVIARNPHSIPADTLNALGVLGRSRTLERVVVCYLHPGAEAQDPGRGGGVEYVHLKEPAEMELPPVCKTEEHAFWPKWRSHADTVFGGY